MGRGQQKISQGVNNIAHLPNTYLSRHMAIVAEIAIYTFWAVFTPFDTTFRIIFKWAGHHFDIEHLNKPRTILDDICPCIRPPSNVIRSSGNIIGAFVFLLPPRVLFNVDI